MKNAYVSVLCGGDAYLPGIEALGRSLDATGTREPRLLLVTADVPVEALRAAARVGWEPRAIESLANPNPPSCQLYARFGKVFTKLRAWQLTEVDRVVLLDADTIVLRNVDELFLRGSFAAAPDFFLPDRFNSGVMVLAPCPQTFGAMVEALARTEAYDGGDQGFLNGFFPDWYAGPVARRLPTAYNTHHFIYQFLRGHPSLGRELAAGIKVVHYTLQKPWLSLAMISGGAALWWSEYFAAHPELERGWKQDLHRLEDRAFDALVAVLGG